MRKNKPSGYKVGDTWKCIDKNGRIAIVWLSNINETFEVWRWSWHYSDGSGGNFDWATSKTKAVQDCPVVGRYKRVKIK